MDAALKRKSFSFGVPGISLEVGGSALAAIGGNEAFESWGLVDWCGLILFAVGRVLLLVGISYYAMGKGRSRWFTLLGVLGSVGVLVLAVVPDLYAKRKAGRCLRCGYDLSGLRERVCPECGDAFESARGRDIE